MTQYVEFDGIQGRVTASGYPGVAGSGIAAAEPRSVSFWVTTTGYSEMAIASWGDDLQDTIEDGEQNRLRLNRGKVQMFSKTSYRETASGINDGNWHHVVFTYAGGAFEQRPNDLRVRNFADAVVYLDGELNTGVWFEDGVTDVKTPADFDLVIGARPKFGGGYTDFFAGGIDEFAVWRTVIDHATVSGAYNGGVRGADLLALDQAHKLQVWYRMGDDVGDSAPGTLVDQGSGGFPGIATSGTSILS